MTDQEPHSMTQVDYRAVLDATGQDQQFMARIEPLISSYARLIAEQDKEPDRLQHSRNVSALGLQVSGTRECLKNALHLPSLCQSLFAPDSGYSRERLEGLMDELKGLERALRHIRSELPESQSTDHLRDLRTQQRMKFIALLASAFREHFRQPAGPDPEHRFHAIVNEALRASHDPVKAPQAEITRAQQRMPEFFS
jgi:hypothetical protein